MDAFVFDHGGSFTLCQSMLACMSEGDQVDVRYTFDGGEPCASGEMPGKTVATLTNADGRVEHLWEVNNETPALSDNHAAKAFNAYRRHLALFLREPFPEKVAINSAHGDVPERCNGKNIISRAFTPSNLCDASGRMWFWVDLEPPGDANTEALLTRPMPALDAVILAAMLTLCYGSPPLVFGIAPTVEGRAMMPLAYTRVHYEDDERFEREDKKPFLVM
jgi:hypothetical protein